MTETMLLPLALRNPQSEKGKMEPFKAHLDQQICQGTHQKSQGHHVGIATILRREKREGR